MHALQGQPTREQTAHPVGLVEVLAAPGAAANRHARSVGVHHELLAGGAVVTCGAAAELLDLLALCAALTLNALPSIGAASDANALAKAVGLDMADWWEPTAQGYLNHVPKAQIVQALKEARPDLADDGVGAMKKNVLVVKAASRLAGKQWLPAMLLPRPAPER